MIVLNVDTLESKEGVDKKGGQRTFIGHGTLGVMQLYYCH